MNAQRLTKSPRPNAVHSAHSAAKSARGAHGVGSAAKSVGSAAKLIDKGTWCKRLSTLVLTLCLIVTMAPMVATPQTAQAAPPDVTAGDFTLSATDAAGITDADYSFVDGVLTIKSGKALTIKNTDSAQATGNRIVVQKDIDANLTLAGVNIDVSGASETAAFLIENNSTGNVTLTLAGDNTLKSGQYQAGLSKAGTSGTLTIKGGGSLTANGGKCSAGIGSGYNPYDPNKTTYPVSNITIEGGTISAFAGSQEVSAAGIGGGGHGEASHITISGGTITAVGSGVAAGIGSGLGASTSDITITGGTVVAQGGVEGAGIGCAGGINFKTGVAVTATNITISGGTVTARGGWGAAGIGCSGQMYSGRTSNITISGGTVTAIGGGNGAGIGCGTPIGKAQPIASDIIISGGSVKVIAGSGANAIGVSGRSVVIPTDGKGNAVYPHVISNAGNEQVTIDGTTRTPSNHVSADSSDTNLYAWSTKGEHTVIVGTKETKYKFVGDDNKGEFVPESIDFSVQAKQSLFYDKTSHELVEKGTTSWGRLQYKLGETGAYSDAIPTATEIGTYTVYYKVISSSGLDATTEKQVTAEIVKLKDDSQTVSSADKASVTYGDTLQLTASVGILQQQQRAPIRRAPQAPATDKVKFYVGTGNDAKLLGEADVTYADATKKDSGTATLTINTKNKQLKLGANAIYAQYGGSVSLNNSDSSTITVTVNPKSVTPKWTGTEERAYDGTASSVSATPAGVETGDDVQLSVAGGTESKVGTHTARATLGGADAQWYTLQNPDQTYTINPNTIEVRVRDIPDQTYNGKAHVPGVRVFNGDREIPSGEYTVQYSKNTDAGQAEVVVTGKGNYIFTTTANFTINPFDITRRDATHYPDTIISSRLTYNGQPQQPTGKVEYTNFYEGRDKTTMGTDRVSVTGTWGVVTNVDEPWVFTANGNFTGVITESGYMNPLPLTVEWTEPSSFVYDGKPHRVYAKVVGALNGDENKMDIVLFDKDARSRTEPIEKTNVGNYETWVYIIDGIEHGNYSVSYRPIIRNYWSITQAPNSFTSELSLEGWAYGDTPNMPQVTAQFGTPTFEYATEQGGAYSENVPTDAGNYWVRTKVAETSNWQGAESNPVSFEITRKDIADAKVELEAAPVYNGQEQAQNVAKVEVNGKELTAGVDYQVSDNTATDVKADGSYTLTITGKDNYTGTTQVEWNIAPATPTENPAKKTAAKSFKGKPLSQAAVTQGEMLGVDNKALEGTFAWEDSSKIVSAAGTQRMVFTPADATNYASLTFNVNVSIYTPQDTNLDANGDGKPDVNLDTNGDGKADVNIDTDGDGKADLNIDTNGDGKPDVNVDTNGDGKPDLNVDTNNDGKPDTNIDANGDGIVDSKQSTKPSGTNSNNSSRGGNAGGSSNNSGLSSDSEGAQESGDKAKAAKDATIQLSDALSAKDENALEALDNSAGDANNAENGSRSDTSWMWAVAGVLIAAAIAVIALAYRMRRR